MEEKIRDIIKEYRNKIMVMQETIERLEKIVDDESGYITEEENVREMDEM